MVYIIPSIMFALIDAGSFHPDDHLANGGINWMRWLAEGRGRKLHRSSCVGLLLLSADWKRDFVLPVAALSVSHQTRGFLN